MSLARKAAFLLDRTAVLFLGLALGGIIAYSFFAAGGAPSTPEAVSTATATGAPAEGGTAASAAPVDISPVVTPRLAAAAAEGRTVHVGVFGDSFGDGIYSSLYQQLRGERNFEVHKFSHQATGFTRYRTTNLLDDTRRRIDARPIDIAVLSFGANDMQGVFVDGRGSEFMSDRWKEIVAGRVGEVVALLRARGAAVYWVGLPKMREAEYDRSVQQMNAFYTQQMARLGVPFVDTVATSVDSGGAYAPYLTDADGERFSARANDGIHMTFKGYSRLTRGLADRIIRSTGGGDPGSRQASGNASGSRG